MPASTFQPNEWFCRKHLCLSRNKKTPVIVDEKKKKRKKKTRIEIYETKQRSVTVRQPAVTHEIYFVVFVACVLLFSSILSASLPLLPQRTSVRFEFTSRVKTDDFYEWNRKEKTQRTNERSTVIVCLWRSINENQCCCVSQLLLALAMNEVRWNYREAK